MTRTRRDVMVAAGWSLRFLGTLEREHWLEGVPAHPIRWAAASHSSMKGLKRIRRKVVSVDVLPGDGGGF
jgi:hypothetical protein